MEARPDEGNIEPQALTVSKKPGYIRRMLRILGLALTALLFGGCAATPQGPYWGADATPSPGWARIGDAALAAATDPVTWAPALGAAGLQIGDADDEIAEWANEETPLFGSRGTAADASDGLRAASWGAYALAGLFAPAPQQGDWLATKAKGFAVGGGAILATLGTTQLLKDTVDRTRPLGQDRDSFPSGHTSSASVSARLGRNALGYYDLSRGARIGSDIGLAGLAVMTGWARVEAGEHHPADVLASMALGNFLAVFATKAFLEPTAGGTARLQVAPSRDGIALGLNLSF